jgi:hypothetical protein
MRSKSGSLRSSERVRLQEEVQRSATRALAPHPGRPPPHSRQGELRRQQGTAGAWELDGVAQLPKPGGGTAGWQRSGGRFGWHNSASSREAYEYVTGSPYTRIDSSASSREGIASQVGGLDPRDWQAGMHIGRGWSDSGAGEAREQSSKADEGRGLAPKTMGLEHRKHLRLACTGRNAKPTSCSTFADCVERLTSC